MKQKYFDINDTLYEISEKYPETIDVFASNGFSQMRNLNARQTMGKAVTLQNALKTINKNVPLFCSLLEEVIAINSSNQEEEIGEAAGDALIEIAGVLPCPLKLPLMDSFQHFSLNHFGRENAVSYRLKSASGGIEWLEEEVRQAQNASGIADLFISAGFELFFDQTLIGRFRDQSVFADLSGLTQFNRCFNDIDLKDPHGNYSILAAVPAIFLVNTDELKGRPVPRSWDDILADDFINSVSLPVEDLDLFNAVMLSLLKTKGEDAIQRLGKNLFSSLHPAQMVKSGKKSSEEKPAVTVLPWFFTRMVFPGSGMDVIWPEDGAIISPVFAAAKRKKAELLKPVVAFFESVATGEIFSRGHFPSVNPDVNSRLPENGRFQWLGWDYIYNHDISERIEYCTGIFNQAREGNES